MTEAEWNDAASPYSCLEFLRGKASDRKLRLFACACCRLTPEADRLYSFLNHAERLADTNMIWEPVTDGQIHWLAYQLRRDDPWVAACNTISVGLNSYVLPKVWAEAEEELRGLGPEKIHAEQQRRVERTRNRFAVPILHDIFGNPFRPGTIDPGWLAWNGAAVLNLARVIYEERAFDRLPILADALEDAGCHVADILQHCRGNGEHVLGCWVLDLLLGKQ
jgi:hypothetical protein